MTRRLSAAQPSLLIVVSDLHCGSTLGLLPPEFDIDGETRVSPLARGASAWMWSCWQQFIREAKHAALRRRVFLLVNGDAIDGQVKDTSQVVTSNPVIRKR